ncbi:MAG TPA: HyaD/HybD family hydrogenase maturation endopeptidase [Holophagaceae bacterium]|nr:HyaD/HybD family hydrogenase maturation endopeptidase [Holophagaceae bacterium]
MSTTDTLVLGIGNLLQGDEGVGVHVARYLQDSGLLPPNVLCVDGGTSSLTLLDPMLSAGRVILVDATQDGNPPGTLTRLEPRFAADFPPRLTAHDIGLKDLLDSFYLLGARPEVVLFTVSIRDLQGLSLELSGPVAEAIPIAAQRVLEELADSRQLLA